MSSPAQNGPASSFHSRLNRVAEARTPHDAAKPQVAVLPDWKENIGGKAGMIVAVLVGIVAVLLVRIAEFQLLGTAMVTETPDPTLALESAAALFLSLVLFRFTAYRGVKYVFAQFAGVAAMITLMHNAVHALPTGFAMMFSPEWTVHVIQSTEPASAYVRGEIIPFSPAEEVAAEDPAAPLVRRAGKL